MNIQDSKDTIIRNESNVIDFNQIYEHQDSNKVLKMKDILDSNV
jgi:copper(I)-binding protein